MEQNLNALGAPTPEAATDEPASPVNPEAGFSPDPDEFRFPPPAGFDGTEEGWPGDPDYRRALTEAEQAVVDADEEAGVDPEDELARQCARRDLYFGFAGDDAEDQVFSPKGPEPCETSEPSGDPGADRLPEAPPGGDEA